MRRVAFTQVEVELACDPNSPLRARVGKSLVAALRLHRTLRMLLSLPDVTEGDVGDIDVLAAGQCRVVQYGGPVRVCDANELSVLAEMEHAYGVQVDSHADVRDVQSVVLDQLAVEKRVALRVGHDVSFQIGMGDGAPGIGRVRHILMVGRDILIYLSPFVPLSPDSPPVSPVVNVAGFQLFSLQTRLTLVPAHAIIAFCCMPHECEASCRLVVDTSPGKAMCARSIEHTESNVFCRNPYVS